MIAQARAATRAAGSFARNPVRYTRQNRVPGAVFLFLGLVAIAVLRRGALPDERGLIAILGAAMVLALAASVAPDLVTWVLLVAIVVSVLQNERILTDLVGQGTRRFRAAFEEVA